MKRKLFTLLAAFMALATFQSNAQGVSPYDGETLHYLNVWTADYEVNRPNGFVDNFINPVRNESAKDYPISADTTVNSRATQLQAMKYVFNRNFDRWELTNNHRVGTVGDVDTYFTLKAGTGNKTNTYSIKSASPNSKGDEIFFKGTDGIEYRDFVFLRFLQRGGDGTIEYDGDNSAPGTEKDSVGMVPWSVKYATPLEGGYLAANIFTGRNNGGVNDRSLYVVAYDTTLNVNNAPNNRYAIYSMDEVRDNWRDCRTNASKVRIVPVWVKTELIGGRWANVTDFPDEFVQFRIQQGTSGAGLLSISGKTIFSVSRAGELDFGSGSQVPADKSVAPATTTDTDGASNAVNGAETSRLYDVNGDQSSYVLQYFTISDPCDGKVVRVVRDQVYSNALLTGVGQFGNKLELRAPGETMNAANGLAGATEPERTRTQQFAIWINENGNMELYPLNSWTFITTEGNYKTSAPTSPGFNYAVWMDNPKATTSDNGATNFNNSFKIGQASATPCTGPVTGSHIGYSNLELRPEKADLINKIDKKRYYFLQVATRNPHGAYYGTANNQFINYNSEVLVLDLVRTSDGKKRVVLTPMEKNRYAGAADGRYFDTPYDSINMSAHWRFEAVEGGYNIINELNDTLEYAYSDLAVVGDQSAYIADQVPDAGYKSDVWQTVHLDCFNGAFKLRNMAESTTERPVLDKPYLDTLAFKAGLTDGSTGLWYAGTRGRQAIGTAYETKYLQKDVLLAGNNLAAGLKFTLRAIDYEYPVGGNDDNQTNHTDDGYKPADDSLCTYLYKQGNYDIVEALSLKLRVDVSNGIDQVFGKNVAKMNFFTDESPWLFVEPVYNEENNGLTQYQYLIPTTYTDENSIEYPNVDYMLSPEQMKGLKEYANSLGDDELTEFLKLDSLALDVYKWHYIKNAQGEYLVYDTINTTTPLSQQQFGLKFAKVDRNNATPFRFYQPLVGDKSKENFILEFRVNKHDYTINRQNAVATGGYKWNNEYATDNYGINPLIAAGQTDANSEWAINTIYDRQTIVDHLKQAITDVTQLDAAELLDVLKYLQQEHAARTKYAILATGSDLLLSTWNAGQDNLSGMQAATRFHFRGPDSEECPRDYVSTKYLIDNQIYYNPTVKANMMDVSVSPAVATEDFIGAKGSGYADNNTTGLNLLITLADTLKAYTSTVDYGFATNNMQNPNLKGEGYIKGFRQEYTRSSSGVVSVNTTNDAKFDEYRHYKNTKDVELYYIQNAANPKLYLTVDTSSIYSQSFDGTLNGVSGVKLIWKEQFNAGSQNGSTVGEVTDYRPLQMFAIYGCKNEQAPFGHFILIPAASWEVNYTAPQKQTRILANEMIGNGTVTDEFRISEAYTGGSQGSNYMIVMPSSQNAPQGVTPTEYTLSRDPYYTGDFCHHNFVQKESATGKYYASWNDTTSKKNYYNPAMHWEVEKVSGSKNLYKFTPESSLWDGDGEKLSPRNQLTKEYFFVKVSESTTEFGGKIETFNAIPKYEPLNIVKLTITCITEQPGDACTTAFKKFSTDDLLYDWGIIETVHSDRYIYSKGTENGSGYAPGDAANAFYAQVGKGESNGIQFLRIRESNTVCDAEHHCIPYYNIIHVVVDPYTKLEKEYYLEMREDVVRFKALTDREKEVIVNFDSYEADTMQAFKFCFPFKRDAEGNDSVTVALGTFENVAVRTMPQHNQIYWLAVNVQNTTETKAVKTSDDADVFYFGPKADSDEEWIGNVDKEGWLKDFSRSDVYVVEPSGESNVNYGLLSFTSNVKPDINDGKFKFTMVYDTIVNKYAKTHIWYYYIQDQAGNYLTYAPETMESKYHYGDYTYAYFAGKLNSAGSHGVDRDYSQTFGLQIDKKKATSGHGFPFWIVAQVPSGEYKYLAQYNSRMVFIPSTSANKAFAQDKAMTFEVGKINGNNFTGNEGVKGSELAVYGIEGAVKVANAEGVIELYTIDGRQFKSVVATSGEQTITAPRGVIIVKNAGKAVKVVVK